MLSKTATMLLGLINTEPLNAYEIIKKLQFMNVKSWYEIADSTVYATIKTLEKKSYILGKVQKDGNMPDKTVYSITDKGTDELIKTIKNSIVQFNYDTNIFAIAAFFIMNLNKDDRIELLQKRISLLYRYLDGISKQIEFMEKSNINPLYVANIIRNKEIVKAEISSTEMILKYCWNKACIHMKHECKPYQLFYNLPVAPALF